MGNVRKTFEVVVDFNENTGLPRYYSCQDQDGNFWSPFDAATRLWDDNGELKEELWLDKEGRNHREGNLPAWILRDPKTKVIYLEQYAIHGDVYRTIKRNRKTGEVTQDHRPEEGLNRPSPEI